MEPTAFVPHKGQAASSSLSTDTASPTRTISQPEPVNLFVAAQRGDVDTIRRLIESGEAKATDRDEANITALHWAAINAQLPACKYLLDQGAEVDALGGDLVATPMQWAARNGYLYIIDLLISHNADPNISDSQGYNTLHLITHSSTVMPLLYILQQPISPDTPDSQGHTALMWAAYQGDAISVDLLLHHGASVRTKDATGLSPLHWAVVRGNRFCIRKLIEAGADLNARDDSGKTPREMAVELKSIGPWKRALEEGGLSEDGRKIGKPLSERNTKLAILILPTLFFYLIFTTLSVLPWFTALPLALAEFFAQHHVVTRVLLNHKSYTENVASSPYFAGIIVGSMFWVGEAWATKLVKATSNSPFTNLFFAIAFALCAYNFLRAVMLDPGYSPKPTSDADLKAIIQDLTSEGRLNGQTFCIACMARRPLRSKHCRICDRCVARHDHHCPWTWNCVGARNHRQFLIFVITLVFGIITFDYLTVAYYSSPLPPPPDAPLLSTSPELDTTTPEAPICIFPSVICDATARDPFLFSVACWATLQLSWTLVLLGSQLWQVARQMTTLEVTNLGRFGFMGGRGGSMSGQLGHSNVNGDGEGLDGSDGVGSGGLGGHGASHGHRHTSGFLMNIFGLDKYTKGKAADGLARAAHAKNPFDLGVVGNCRDFWTVGKELGVDYETLYDVPPEGFKEAKRRKSRLEEESGFPRPGPGHKRSASGSITAFGRSIGRSLGFGSARVGGAVRSTPGRGYEPLNMAEDEV